MGAINKGGRPAYEPRDDFKVRPTRAVGARIREEADLNGLTYTELCTRIVSEHFGLPVPKLLDIQPAGQEHLDMAG